MSRVYDALQQCIPDQVTPDTAQPTGAEVFFLEQFSSSGWDPTTAPAVQAKLSGEDRIPALVSNYSSASEQFRLLATRLQQLRQTRAFKSVLLTSSVEGEGKTLLTLNLAISLAQGGQQKVLIVDADLRKPGLTPKLKAHGRAGLREWYKSDRPIVEFICRVSDLNFWVLPAGESEVDPLELLNSPRILQLQTSLNACFDWVLIDAPPLLPLADAEIISRMSDATIIAVRRDKSPKSALKEALQRVAPSKTVGLLLNEFPINRAYSTAQ